MSLSDKMHKLTKDAIDNQSREMTDYFNRYFNSRLDYFIERIESKAKEGKFSIVFTHAGLASRFPHQHDATLNRSVLGHLVNEGFVVNYDYPIEYTDNKMGVFISWA